MKPNIPKTKKKITENKLRIITRIIKLKTRKTLYCIHHTGAVTQCKIKKKKKNNCEIKKTHRTHLKSRLPCGKAATFMPQKLLLSRKKYKRLELRGFRERKWKFFGQREREERGVS